MTRNAYVHEAILTLDAACDPRAVGAAVTSALCGHWEHDGPCRWPHNNDISPEHAPASFRTLFIAEPGDEPEVRARIEHALHDDARWMVQSSGAREPHASEGHLADRLRHVAPPE
jgi:hypothetical protein